MAVMGLTSVVAALPLYLEQRWWLHNQAGYHTGFGCTCNLWKNTFSGCIAVMFRTKDVAAPERCLKPMGWLHDSDGKNEQCGCTSNMFKTVRLAAR
jgi:hypothetical protein